MSFDFLVGQPLHNVRGSSKIIVTTVRIIIIVMIIIIKEQQQLATRWHITAIHNIEKVGAL